MKGAIMKGLALPFLGAVLTGVVSLGSETMAQQVPQANVVRIEYNRYPYEKGRSFGEAGPYERIVGTVSVEADPNHPAYREIVDIDKAPRNASGRVEYEAQFLLLRPVDPGKANGTLLSLVPNRGNLAGIEPGFLRRGFMILNVAWSGDVLPVWSPAEPESGRLLMKVPIATNSGQPLTGRVRVNYTAEGPFVYTLQLGDGPHSYLSHDGYEAVSTDNRGAVLTVRERYWDERVAIPNSDWMFAYCPFGTKWGPSKPTVVPSPMHLCVPAGLKPGWVYELIYEAKNPRVMGLGLASTRDAVSFFRFTAADADGTPNPLFVNGRPMTQRAIVGGSSQTGRYVREFLYMGFHVDAQGRLLAEGLWPNVTAGRIPLNLRFASPSQGFLQQLEEDFPSYEFPVAYQVMEDPFSGRVDGVLKRCQQMNNCPKIIHTVSGSEYWNERVSLVTTDPLGTKDLSFPENIRFYLFSSTAHNRPGPQPRIEVTHGLAPLHKELTNVVSFEPHTRALLVALDEWIRNGREPPPSMYPRISDGTLVGPDQESTGFPRIPGVEYPRRMNEYQVFDYGPEFRSKGIITNHPPKMLAGKKYGTLVPKVDADGIDSAGVRPLAMMVPVGTYTGWSLRSEHAGAENELWRLRGSFIPFAESKAERMARGDPRLSLEERYGSHEGYVARVRAAAGELVAKRLLLQEDADRIVDEAMKSDVLRR
ncbi:MAG: hypothetical protein HY704_15160 [Gemmatimonadetes bacterium]|nr:hypothetical protein [Gemmatimonadota bacterium]